MKTTILFCITVLIALALTNDLKHDGGCPDTVTNPLTTNKLASDFSPQDKPDSEAIEAIRTTLALYPFAIDGKNYDALDKVFTKDAVANYSAPINTVNGLDAIKAAIAPLLQVYASTHHLYGTQVINVCSRTTAVSVTYFTATHFVSSNVAAVDQFWESEILYAYGRYEDALVKQDDGTWRIKHRNLVYMVS